MRHRLLWSLLLGLSCLLPHAAAADGGFIATLSTEQQNAAGLAPLSAGEQAALNALVAREVAFARQGNVRAFAGTFLSRRKPAELAEAGLDRLSPAEQERLNAAVANAIASGPVQPEPRALKQSDVTSARERLQVHGRVSLAYGWGGGGSYRAGSISTDIYDPETGLELGLGLGEISGKGWWGCDTSYAGYDSYRGERPVTGFADWRGGGGCLRRH
jgi:hypothetical protein